MANYQVKDVIQKMDAFTGGRVVTGWDELFHGDNPFVVMKSSNIPGKGVMEIPGLVWGRQDKMVNKIAVCMTMTEQDLELANAMDIDMIIAHHPVADATNSGGVNLKYYLDLYDIAVAELHEAFHGLHPGLPFLHGHQAFRVEIAYGQIPGNIMFVGESLEEVNCLGDMLERLKLFMDRESDEELLKHEKDIREDPNIQETNMEAGPKILLGDRNDKVNTVLHFFPHTGFSPAHMAQAKEEHPEIDTVLTTISRVDSEHPLVEKASELGLNFVTGNSHALEIFENGLPMAKTLEALMPGVEVFLFRERVTATAVSKFGNHKIQEYADMIASKHLLSNT